MKLAKYGAVAGILCGLGIVVGLGALHPRRAASHPADSVAAEGGEVAFDGPGSAAVDRLSAEEILHLAGIPTSHPACAPLAPQSCAPVARDESVQRVSHREGESACSAADPSHCSEKACGSALARTAAADDDGVTVVVPGAEHGETGEGLLASAGDFTLELVAQNARLQAQLEAQTRFAAEKEELLEKLALVRIENMRLQTMLAHCLPPSEHPEIPQITHPESTAAAPAVEPWQPFEAPKTGLDPFVGLRGKALYTSNSPDAQAELPTKAAGQPISWQDLAKTDGGEAQPAAGWNLTEILNEIVPVNTVHNAQLASQLKQQIEHLELQLENLQLKERVAELEKQLGTAKGPEPAPPQTAAESNDADAPQ